MVACSGILSVEPRGKLPSDRLDDPTLARVLMNSVIGDVECGWDAYVAGAAWLSDEYEPDGGQIDDDALASRNVGPGHPAINSATCDVPDPAMYIPLQIARVEAESTLAKLNRWNDQQVGHRSELIAEVSAYGAYALIPLGEAFDSVAFGDGQHWAADSALARAEAWLTTAIQLATVDSIKAFAHAGRARVRLDRGNLAGAASDALLVPPGFHMLVTREGTLPRRSTKLSSIQGRNVVAPAYRARNVNGVSDPRVPIVGPVAVGTYTAFFYTSKYPTASTPHRLASFREAQYILAEATGGAQAVSIINSLRDSVGLPHFAGGTAAQIQATIIDERSREFFSEGGIRLADLLRLGMNWKTGVDPIRGQPYGSTRRLPLPRIERDGVR
jgi:hypothetical protein